MTHTKLDLFKAENPKIYEQMVAYLQSHTFADTAQEYCSYFQMKPSTLMNNLRTWNKKLHLREDNSDQTALQKTTPAMDIVSANPNLPAVNDDGLSEDEVKFLTKFREGDLSFEEVQREFAYRVFKKIMVDPRLLKASDWLKSEVVKIQREELSMKKEQMERAWGIIFGGFKIPKNCPNCGHDLQPKVSSPNDEAIINATQDLKDHDDGSLADAGVIS